MRGERDVHQLMVALWRTNSQKPVAFRSMRHSAAVNASIKTNRLLDEFAVFGEDMFRLLTPYLLDPKWRKLAGFVLARACETALRDAVALSRGNQAEMQEAGLVCLYYLVKIRRERKALDEIRRQGQRGSLKAVRRMATQMDEALDRLVTSQANLEELARKEFSEPEEQRKAIRQYWNWQMLKNATKPFPARTPRRPSAIVGVEQQ